MLLYKAGYSRRCFAETLGAILPSPMFEMDKWSVWHGSPQAVNTLNAQVLHCPSLWHNMTDAGHKSCCENWAKVSCALQATPDPLPFKYPVFVHLLPPFEGIFGRAVFCFGLVCVFFFFFKNPLISCSVFLPLLNPLKVALRRHWHQTDTLRFPTSYPFMATDVEILYPFYLSLFALFL